MIYIMLGYNELGYDHDYSAKRYKEALDRIQEFEPEAIIYICSNLHVTEELSSKDELFNNEIINGSWPRPRNLWLLNYEHLKELHQL